MWCIPVTKSGGAIVRGARWAWLVWRGGDVDIETRIGGIDEMVRVRIRDGAVMDKDFVVHFPIPMHKAWDNVVYTCSVMLLFQNTAQVVEWCAERGVPVGDVRPIEQIWSFASEWYSRHADPNWVKWTVAEAAEMFNRHGLTGPIWALPEQTGRF
ncbi:MAG: organomercurial lyase [Rhodothermales bacterium]